MTTHTTYLQRPNGDEEDIEIEVEFTLTGGDSGIAPSMNHPGEPPSPPDFEIVQVMNAETGANIDLTPDEIAAVQSDVFGRLGDFEDDGWEEF